MPWKGELTWGEENLLFISCLVLSFCIASFTMTQIPLLAPYLRILYWSQKAKCTGFGCGIWSCYLFYCHIILMPCTNYGIHLIIQISYWELLVSCLPCLSQLLILPDNDTLHLPVLLISWIIQPQSILCFEFFSFKNMDRPHSNGEAVHCPAL